MTISFTKLPMNDLQTLANALRSGRLPPPYTKTMVQRHVSNAFVDETSAALIELAGEAFTPRQIALLIDAARAERSRIRRPDEIIDLVTTGPDAPGVMNRDTSVVVRALFAEAKESVLIAGYSVYQGDQVFGALANRMQAIDSLDVKFFLDISRNGNDSTESSILVRRFMERFRRTQWPDGFRLPDIYYDPRSLALDKRSSLHAKCIVIDNEIAFVSSANFTNAGQERNIEVDVLLRTPNR